MMLSASLKAFLLVAGGTAAVATTAYLTGALDRFIQAPPVAVSVPADPGVATPDAQPLAPATPQIAVPPVAPAKPPAAAAEQPAAPDLIAPSFDLVRVESDGSIVIAGKAAPNASVEALAGSKVIGQTKAGSEGDFAIIVDQPLKPGAYQIVLRSTDENNLVAMSPETAVVSIPERPDGQVLALVEQPGQPSKLITVPEPAPQPAEPQQVAAAPAQDETPAPEAAPAQPAEDVAALPAQPESPAVPATEPQSDAPAPAQAPEAQPETPAQPAQAPVDAPQPAAAETPSPESRPEPAPEQAAAPQPTPAAPQPANPPAVQPSEPPVSREPVIEVRAVEIEGNKVFVAGIADPKGLVRAYANQFMLGETRASEGGQFLVEALRELPVGDYIVRADLIGPDGIKVIRRAQVPFRRPAGEAVAAVAPAQPAAPPAQQAATPAQPEVAADPTPPAADAPAQPVVAAAPASPGPGPSIAVPDPGLALATEPPSFTAEALQPTEGSVIIRRGDTLWQISRRVYGRGVRYSTIYLANQTQISDPDRIWPGQIFAVPGKTEEGETADLGAVADRQPHEGDQSSAPR